MASDSPVMLHRLGFWAAFNGVVRRGGAAQLGRAWPAARCAAGLKAGDVRRGQCALADGVDIADRSRQQEPGQNS
jgi:hypothetical protein